MLCHRLLCHRWLLCWDVVSLYTRNRLAMVSRRRLANVRFRVVSRLSAFGRNIAKADVQLSGLCSTMCHWPRHDKRMRDQFPTASRSQRAALRHLVAALLQQRGQMAVGLCRPPPPWPSRCPPSDVRAGLRSRTAQTRPAFAERRYQPGWNPGSRPSPITPRPSRGKLDRYAIPRV